MMRSTQRLTKKRYLPAFSLVEMVVTMAIVAIVMVMLSNVLITSINISHRSIARSFVREEIADIIEKISDDVRSATEVINCQGEMLAANCQLLIAGEVVRWSGCTGEGGDPAICKYDSGGQPVYLSPGPLQIDTFSFDQGFDAGTSTVRRNVLITLVASHTNPSFNVTNLVGQTSVSTRNYYLIGN
ncbi:type II secretion system protein [Candidatus Dojkabacteria bacterium]|uniref:Type II secretion system protein n=1 Tax=Candidatus Dojkabacteria bacterium TaxID=2099670 RepID=A0A955I4Z7_9BACT|nr:type II secretion system protein [Candidatus Dojkabacteria bacterium]